MLPILAAAPAPASIPVALWRSGDDGLSLRVSEAIEMAFAASPAFSLQPDAEITILAPSTNVRWKGVDGRLRITFAYEIDRQGRKIAYGHGHCSERKLTDCADVVLRAARKSVRK